MTAQAPQQSRRGGTASRRAERASAPLIQERYITREIPLYELISEEGVELLHEQSMTILEEIGIEFRDEPALKLWREAGADVRDQRVRIPRELLLEKLALTPAEYTQHARNPDRNVLIGGGKNDLAPVYGPPFLRRVDNEGR